MTKTEYETLVQTIATEIRAEAEGSHNREVELVTERCDSECTYTSDCLDVLNYTKNDSAYFDNFGSLTASGFTQAVQLMATAALEQDVHEALSSLPDYESEDDSDDSDD